MDVESDKVNVILATDCGSTTSKARFFKKIGNEYRYVESGEAPTTVETPYEDVTLGVRNAVREVEELTGHKLLFPDGIIMPSNGENEGVDIYVTTSSAGGGLQMAVIGVVKTMTGESAERAALGAGGIVMDVVAIDDGRETYEKVKRLRLLRPDMILFAGGTDGGAVTHVEDLAQFIKMADPQHRLGAMYRLPIIYAGNVNVQQRIKEVLGEKYALVMVENIRPTLDTERVGPARDAIHEVFMEHVMSHAPGYSKLSKWTPIPIMPTPSGEGMMFRTYAELRNLNVIGVGLGGATTNIYSVYDEKFVRSVSANLGMSYSVCNVLKEAGIHNILRWIPFDISETNLLDRLYNKMIRPTTIPQTVDELIIEHALAREALRLGFNHHKLLARPLLGVVSEVGAGLAAFMDKAKTETYIDMLKVNALGGTGGLLSHAPRRVQSMMVLIDGFSVEGVTSIFQDSVFMMPHLGVLSMVHKKAALDIFEKDCLVRLGTCIALKGESKGDRKIADASIRMPNGEVLEEDITFGTIKRLPLGEEMRANIEIRPSIGFDVGAGSGRKLTQEVEGGVVGIIIDARGRPISLPKNEEERRKKLIEWFIALDAYPKESLMNGGK